MADHFRGNRVQVKLKNPPATLSGCIVDVKGQELLLEDIVYLETGKHDQHCAVDGANIEDLRIVDVQPPPAPLGSQGKEPLKPVHPKQPVNQTQQPPLQAATAIAPSPPIRNGHSKPQAATRKLLRPAQIPPASVTTFHDPAILSYDRTPVKQPVLPVVNQSISSGRDQTMHPPPQAETHAGLSNGQHTLAATISPDATTPLAADGVPASLSTPSNILQINADDTETIEDAEEARIIQGHEGTQAQLEHDNASVDAKGKKRRRQRRKKRTDGVDDADSGPDAARNNAPSTGHAQDGWRQTPILTPQASIRGGKAERTPGLLEGKAVRDAPNRGDTAARKHQRALDKEANKNGWGTEDASDVRDMPDFDFEDSRMKFDKKAVWDELRAGDTTADEDRLVSFNRVTTPGTFGGQKLHPTENVLDGGRKVSRDFEDEDSDLDLNARPLSTSQILRREPSRASFARQTPSRKDSLRTEVQATAPSMVSRSLSRRKLADHAALSPRIPGLTSPSSSAFSPAGTNIASSTKPQLRYVTSNRPCRTATPETLQSIENLAQNGFAMSDDILAENAGRGIAELVLSTLDPTGHRLDRANHNSTPVIVMLIGEAKAGARALAAARHLLERNVRVIAALTGTVDLEHGPLSLQVQRIRGKIIRSWAETSAHLKTLDAPPELIVDAILGASDSIETISTEHFETAISMLDWANKSRASVLSIDVPCGVDPTSGAVQMREGEPFEIRAKVVVCCGIPVVGLVEALASREHEEDWRIFVVDIGLNPAARPFLKLRTKDTDDMQKGRFVQFGSEWIVGLTFEGAG